MPRAAKNSLGVVCPHSTRVLGKEGEGWDALAGWSRGGVSKREIWGQVILQRPMSEREGYLVGLRKPGPRSREFWGRDLGNPRAGTQLKGSWAQPRSSQRIKRRRGRGAVPLQTDLENGVGC